MLYGINAEVMPGQWEFQVGYRGVADECADPLTVADQFNEVRDFAALKRKRGLILLFSRSFDW